MEKGEFLLMKGRLKCSLLFKQVDIEISNDYAAHETGHGLCSLIHAHSKSVISGVIRVWRLSGENRGAQYALAGWFTQVHPGVAGRKPD